MILDADEIQAGLVCDPRHREDLVERRRFWRREDPKLQRPPVVRHGSILRQLLALLGVWLFSLALWPSERSSLWRLCLGGGQLLRVRILQAPSLAVALNEGRSGPGIEQYTQLVQAHVIAPGCTYSASRVGRFQPSREGQGGLAVARLQLEAQNVATPPPLEYLERLPDLDAAAERRFL